MLSIIKIVPPKAVLVRPNNLGFYDLEKIAPKLFETPSSVLRIRRDNRDNLGIISHIYP